MDEVNVKVAVRVRPILPKEKLAGESNCVRVLPSTNQLVLGKDRAFTFDHVLPSKTAQENVYETCVAPLVKSCFEGYNCTVFAYGQTGSGKTFTVGGGNIANQTEDEFGIIPRAISDIFRLCGETKGRLVTTKVSYIEIYKEELRDLLDLETPSKDLHVREDEDGNTVLTGVTEVECENEEQVMALLEQGSSYRHTASTQMNDVSSRSHSVFTVLLEQKWVEGEGGAAIPTARKLSSDDGEEEMTLTDLDHYIGSKFHFVDLAGSERAHRTGNIGDRFKESVHINSGLLALGNVISALGDPKRKATHVPYRESKITRLLKDSLGGNAQTLMICCISPSSANFDESLNALKYANRAKNIRNKPIINRDPHSIRFEAMQTEITALREELQRQRLSLMTATANGGGGGGRLAEDQDMIKQLEDKVVRLQTECGHYRMVAEEAYRHLLDIQGRDILSQSLNVRLRDWLELMEEIKNKVPATLNKDAWQCQTITKLEEELRQCRSDLKSDEEIFAEKVKEVAQLEEQNAKLTTAMEELTRTMEEYSARLKTQDEQLVTREMRLQELQARVKELECVGLSGDFELPNVSGPPTTSRRAKSVPAHMLGQRSARLATGAPSARNIHTSPAVFSLERVMQGFRARSQLLNSRLEDSDDVQQQLFSDDDEDSSSGEEETDVPDGRKSDVTPTQSNQGTFKRNTGDRSTYKVREPRTKAQQGSKMADIIRASQTDDEKLQKKGGVQFTGTYTKLSTAEDNEDSSVPPEADQRQRQRLKKHELEVRQSSQKMRDLNINIKMKEQLIKELVQSSRHAHAVNEQYKEKLQAMEKEKQAAKSELAGLQKAMHDLEQKEQHDKTEKEQLQSEFRKKIDTAKIKITTLQKKQKETEGLAAITGHNDKRISELEGAVDKMRAQQGELQKRLKDEVDKKSKLEREMEVERKRVKDLELRTQQQQKVLRVKTEEVTAMQRRLRNGTTGNRISAARLPQFRRDEQDRLEEQRKALDAELEKALEQRLKMDQLEKELQQREDIVAKKEAMLAERSELEIKKLRSSQVLSKDAITLASRLQSVEARITEKSAELAIAARDTAASVREELQRLTQSRDKLIQQRQQLDTRLQQGALLNTQEERRLIELDEAVEALDAAIEYKNEAIKTARENIRKSSAVNQSSSLLSRLRPLSADETRTLLTRYFDKVIDLREQERKKAVQYSTLEMRMEEQEQVIGDLEARLQRQDIDTDRRLTQQQHQYEQKIQVLMQQLMEATAAGSSASRPGSSSAPSLTPELQSKIQQLEKDLYYYKKTSRDLKNKLREVLSGHLQGMGATGEGAMDLASSQESVVSNPSRLLNGGHQPTPPSSGRHRDRDTPCDASGGARDPEWDRLGPARESAAPVRISRKDLRRISEQEMQLRRSQSEQDTDLPTDSLEMGTPKKNSWT